MKRIHLLLVVALIAVLVVSACGSEPEPTTAPEPTAAPEQPAEPETEAGPEYIVIGTSAPMTGMFAGFGQGCTFGAQAAVDDINAQGGIYVKEFDRKIPVKYIVVDNESDPGKSGPLAEDLILRDKVDMLYSVDSSPSIHIPIAEVA
ncbi:MAG: ABC transporter substrate-binding protein, partial [Anaerolineae bacterium]|nr:ABC transporter substrate-binding protein [Anaerolineae bacterium]